VRPNQFPCLRYNRRKLNNYVASRLALSPNGPKQAYTRALSPSSTIRCIQNDFRDNSTFGANHAPMLHQHSHCLQTEQNENPHDPRHLGVLSGACKMISEPMVRSPQTVHISCVNISTISKQIETSFHFASSPRCTIGCVQNNL
jgi:hypothetical protein